MTLPSFIGIGAERCGSTWLHRLLSQHPRIYVPTRRKELDFFNVNYARGVEWYESFFPNSQEAIAYTAIGEISPRYLNFPGRAKRITSIPSIHKLIVILRNPIDRAYSHYGHTVRLQGYSKPFEEFIIDYPESITHGFYAEHLQSFLQYYDRQQLCSLIFEKAIADVGTTKRTLAEFLGVSGAEFPKTAGSGKANETYIPRLKNLNYIATMFRRYLIQRDLDWVINAAKTMGAQQLLKTGGTQTLPPMSQETRLRLQDQFVPHIENLEKLLDINLAIWYASP